jgi:hypothetical protein
MGRSLPEEANEMSDRGLTHGVSSKPVLATGVLKWEPFALFYARFALGAAFLSAAIPPPEVVVLGSPIGSGESPYLVLHYLLPAIKPL